MFVAITRRRIIPPILTDNLKCQVNTTSIHIWTKPEHWTISNKDNRNLDSLSNPPRRNHRQFPRTKPMSNRPCSQAQRSTIIKTHHKQLYQSRANLFSADVPHCCIMQELSCNARQNPRDWQFPPRGQSYSMVWQPSSDPPIGASSANDNHHICTRILSSKATRESYQRHWPP